MRVAKPFALVAAMLLVQGCAGEDDPELDLAAETSALGSVPRFDHVVIAIMENTAYSAIAGSPSAPYINSLMAQGASFTNSHGVTHPSQPNYIALFSGGTQGITSDSCPHTLNNVPNLGRQLLDAGLTMTAYSEDLPSVGFTGCTSGKYARKHAPWTNFSNFPHSNERSTNAFPSDYATLPTVSFVVPNLCNDMHDCSIGTGDSWLRSHLDGYVQWAKTHNSLLILTWDEDDFTASNQIPTVFVGASVRPGNYAGNINHYHVLHTVEAMYGLAALGTSAAPITDVWTSTVPADDFSIALDPTTLTVAPGGAASTTVGTVVTSGNAQTLSLSATGVPSGATVSFTPASISAGASATLTVTVGASTAPGTYSLTVTATGAAATHTASLSLTVSNPGGGSGLVNGDFEVGGLAGWTTAGTTSVSTTTHHGSSSARVGTTTSFGDSSIAQTFTAPAGATQLSFWYRVTCLDTVQWDWATAGLVDNTTGTNTTVLPRTCSNSSTWRKASATLTPGHSYTLTLANHADSNPNDPTYTRYDEVVVGL